MKINHLTPSSPEWKHSGITIQDNYYQTKWHLSKILTLQNVFRVQRYFCFYENILTLVQIGRESIKSSKNTLSKIIKAFSHNKPHRDRSIYFLCIFSKPVAIKQQGPIADQWFVDFSDQFGCLSSTPAVVYFAITRKILFSFCSQFVHKFFWY